MFSHFLAFGKKQRPATAGFSLVELLVSIGILVLVLSIVVTQQRPFNGSVLLRSQAYELALAIREVQQSAISAINSDTSGTDDFRAVLGIHFDTTSGADQRYTIFSDNGTNDHAYDSSDTLFGPPGLLDPRFEIRAVQRVDVGAPVDRTSVSVTFERPNFDAIFESNTGVTQRSGAFHILIGEAGGTGTACPADIRTVEVTATGQISVLEC